MVDETEGLQEAEKLVEKYLRNMMAPEVRSTSVDSEAMV